MAKVATSFLSEIDAVVPYSDFMPIWKERTLENTINSNLKLGSTKELKYFQNFYINSKHPWFWNEKSLERHYND